MDIATVINIVKLGRGLSYATIIMYLLGSLFGILMGASFDVFKFVFGYIIVLTGVLGAVYTNSYYDVAIDTVATQTPISGGSKILVEHPELKKTIWKAMIFLFGLSISLGLVFTILFSFPITYFLLVIIANFIAWSYTAPPLRLVYRGFGEITTMFGIGIFMAGFGYFSMMGTIDLAFVLFSIPLLLLGFAFSFYVEIPDRDADRQGQKITMVVRRDERFGFIIGSFLIAFAALCYGLFGAFCLFSVPANFFYIALFSLIPVVVAVWSLRTYLTDPSRMMPMVFRSAVGVLSVFIFTDAYFIYALIT
jgi:1,4-dihydroxy-2-naphthoate octaprenyltransferase